MSNFTSPSMHEWRKLYQAAVDFKQAKCWEWMYDSDIFGVQNPISKEIGYCSIMGKIGTFFGLGVYLGSEGLINLKSILSGEIDEDQDIVYSQNVLMASFEDRANLEKSDLKIIKELGFKFRGRNQWPHFRRHIPGYFPWYLTKEEAVYLTIAFEQAIIVSNNFKNNQELLESPHENQKLIRVFDNKGGKQEWLDRWLRPDTLTEKNIHYPLNEIRLKKIQKSAAKISYIWEADFFHTPIFEKNNQDERPYYPYLFLCIENSSDMILAQIKSPPFENYLDTFLNEILTIFEETKSFPRKLVVQNEELFNLLKPISDYLNFDLDLSQRLEHLEEVKMFSLQAFSQQ